VYIVSNAVFLVSSPSSKICFQGPIWTVLSNSCLISVSE
jgi:hypothetical protein